MTTQTSYPTAKTTAGREVIVCRCGGGDAHEWRPDGGGARILACPSDRPQTVTTLKLEEAK